MSENLINQYGGTEISLCSEYIKNIFTCRVEVFFFNILGPNQKFIRHLTLYCSTCCGAAMSFSAQLYGGLFTAKKKKSKVSWKWQRRSSISSYSCIYHWEGSEQEKILKVFWKNPGLGSNTSDHGDFWNLQAPFTSANRPWEVGLFPC